MDPNENRLGKQHVPSDASGRSNKVSAEHRFYAVHEDKIPGLRHRTSEVMSTTSGECSASQVSQQPSTGGGSVPQHRLGRQACPSISEASGEHQSEYLDSTPRIRQRSLPARSSSGASEVSLNSSISGSRASRPRGHTPRAGTPRANTPRPASTCTPRSASDAASKDRSVSTAYAQQRSLQRNTSNSEAGQSPSIASSVPSLHRVQPRPASTTGSRTPRSSTPSAQRQSETSSGRTPRSSTPPGERKAVKSLASVASSSTRASRMSGNQSDTSSVAQMQSLRERMSQRAQMYRAGSKCGLGSVQSSECGPAVRAR
jgi:hypothetical protein